MSKENDQVQQRAAHELLVEIQKISAQYFLRRPHLVSEMEPILLTALLSAASHSISLSLAIRTDFMPTEDEIKTHLEQMNSALEEGVKSYLVQWAEVKDSMENLDGNDKPVN